mmetsp:Transcript_14411/g.34751  ORF Transcript_14411/g.34751 Transcript_14411/m.34751 type:complete len:237 (+) Transcript_14411:100-810(+)
MTSSHTNGKKRDRVASYAGGILDRANIGGSSVEVTQKKKAYRARGCRGGASRKNRKKQPITNHSRQNEENDPSRLNTISECHASHEGSPHRKPNNTSSKRDNKHTSGGSDKSVLSSQASSQNKTRTLSILPNRSGLSVHKSGTGGRTAENGLVDQSQHHTNNTGGPKPILPTTLSDSATQTTARGGNNIPSAIERPAANSSTGRSNDQGGQTGGFSFFCISPRSFLSGQVKKNHRG